MNAYVENVDEYLAKSGVVQDKVNLVAKKLNVPSRYIAFGTLSVISWVLFGFLAPLTLSVVAFLYPAIQTIRAIDQKGQQERWLTYWIVYGAFNVVESVADVFLSWLPFYITIKATFLLWCMAPFALNGSFVLYNLVVVPFFNKHKVTLEKMEKRLEDELTSKFQELNTLVINSVVTSAIQEKMNVE